MSKSGIIGVIIVVIVIVVGVIIFGKMSTSQSEQPIAQQSPPQNQSSSSAKTDEAVSHRVEYTNQGFSPHSITIKKGETVTWVNKSGDSMWVASNPHPTHTDYPGFDELQGVPNGGTYSFTFEKIGNWGYHNHLEPSNQGIVVVQ